MKSLKIADRLLLGFFVLLSLVVLTVCYSITVISGIGKGIDDLYEHPFVVSNGIGDIEVSIVSIDRDIKGILIEEDALMIEKLNSRIDQSVNDVFEAFDVVSKAYLGDKEDISRPLKAFKDWNDVREEILFLDKDGRKTEALELKKVKGDFLVSKLISQVKFLRNFAQNKAHEFYQEADHYSDRAFSFIFVIALFTVLLSLIIAFFLIRSISTPLNSIIGTIREICRGNLNEELDVNSNDEIGILAKEFEKLRLNLIHKAEIADRIAVGDFEEKVQANSVQDRLAESMNQIIENFKKVVGHAENIATGRYENAVELRSDKDQLGRSLHLMTETLSEVISHTQKIAEGNYDELLETNDDQDLLALSLNQMTVSLKSASDEAEKQAFVQSRLNDLNLCMQGDHDERSLCNAMIENLVKTLSAQVGCLYLDVQQEGVYSLYGSYAFSNRKGQNKVFKNGEGLVGQTAVEKQVVHYSDLPDHYMSISSGLGDMIPSHLLLIPIVLEGKTLGVIEIASIKEFPPEAYSFITKAIERIAPRVASAISRSELNHLLKKTQEQSDELQVQQEELRQTNEELEAQTSALKKSEEELQAQQEELRVTNEELEEKTADLEVQKAELDRNNQFLEKARVELEENASELEIASKYKSEFLANMSHELRTPLNSLLILSQSLKDNKSKNLSEDQLESLGVIYDSGKFLLNLINEILDLSKIEAGKMEVDWSDVNIKELCHELRLLFAKGAEQKNLDLLIDVEDGLPSSIYSDSTRINQVLRNLLSNAIKFTETGEVKLKVRKLNDSDVDLDDSKFSDKLIAFEVSDSGIGIPDNKFADIFEAFQQVDGSISRRFGGTGLGLSISRQIMQLLGGEIRLKSKLDEGSVFTVYIPVGESGLLEVDRPDVFDSSETNEVDVVEEPKSISSNRDTPVSINPASLPHIDDDRNEIDSSESCILIVEDDLVFSKILYRECHKKGFKCLCSPSGEEALELIREFEVNAILLDLGLPGMSGSEFLQILKQDPSKRHIPVHVLSGQNENQDLFNQGARAFLQKPVPMNELDSLFDGIQNFIKKDYKKLLIVEDNDIFLQNIIDLLEGSDISIEVARTGAEAVQQVLSGNIDCLILDIGLPDISGFEVLNKLEDKGVKIPPVIVYTGKDLSVEENDLLQKYSSSVIIKGVKSEERLIDEIALFLHRIVKELPDNQKDLINKLYNKDLMFQGKTVLIADDDIRNVFALTKLFEEHQMKVIRAENGAKALDVMSEMGEDIDIILMDIMMPVMDGFEAIQKIREQRRFRNKPILAVTAKAMESDRIKCIEMGANDYIPKPIDLEKLFTLMRVWLYR